MKSKLSHLTESQLNELKERYYSFDSIIDLLVEFDIHVSPTQLFKCFPNTPCTETCKICNKNLVQQPVSRLSQGQVKVLNRFKVCPSCDHLPYNPHCDCKVCRANRKSVLNQFIQDL